MTQPADLIGHAMREPSRIRIGFVGIRRINDGADSDWLRETLRAVWSVSAACCRPQPGEARVEILRLVCGMADGADRIAIESYLDWSASLPHELLAMYPCDPVLFRDNSDVADAAGFDALRSRMLDSDCVRELVIDGAMPRSRVPELTPEQLLSERRLRAAAHHFQSQSLIRHSDVLIAVVDRSAPAGVGGAWRSFEQALDAGLPVLVIDPIARFATIPRTLDDVYSAKPGQDDLRSGWTASIRRAIGLDAASNSTAPADWDATAYVASVLSGKQPAPRKTGTRLWRLIDGYCRSRASSNEDREVVGQIVEAQQGQAGRGASSASGSKRKPGWIHSIYMGACHALSGKEGSDNPDSDIGLREMACYRGAFVLNYTRGFIAVMLALSSLYVLSRALGLHSSTWSSYWVMLSVAGFALAAFKLLVVGTIVRDTHAANQNRHAHKAVALRYVYEQLRMLPAMLACGSGTLPTLSHRAKRGLPVDVALDLSRRMSLAMCATPIVRSDGLDAIGKLIEGQYRYHSKKSREMGVLHDEIESFTGVLGKLVFFIICLDIAVVAAKIAMGLELVAHHDPATLKFLKSLGWILVTLTALIPAGMASLSAILFQSMAEQLTERHAAMAESLRSLHREQQDLRQRIENGHLAGGANTAVLSLAEKVSQLLMLEVAEWAGMYRQTVHEA